MPGLPESGPRVALVIGNSAYQSVGFLTNPQRDAAAMVEALRNLGFDDVISAIDLGRADFLARLEDFCTKLNRAETGLLFYAGHGVQVRGRNYLLPCDARITRTSDLRGNSVPLDDIVRAMSRRARTRLLFLDACRNDPISGEAGGLTRGTRSAAAIGSDIAEVGQGLARITATAGTFVAYATEPGNVALDGSGENSPFTTALLRHIARPGLAVDDIMMEVRVDVLDATEGKQLPWNESALTKRFQFKEGAPPPATRDFELEYWNRVKDTDNPDFLQSFLHQFPNGRHAEEARARISGVAKRKEAADWELARTRNTIPALADFVRRHPNSARAGTARARLFLRQLTRGSVMFGSALLLTLGLVVPGMAYLTSRASEHMPDLMNPDFNPLISEMKTVEIVLLASAGTLLALGPWLVFAGVLWASLSRWRGQGTRRVGLTALITFVPLVLCMSFIHIEVKLQNDALVTKLSEQSKKLAHLEAQRFDEHVAAIARLMVKVPAPPLDTELTKQIADTKRYVEALRWRLSRDSRFTILLGALVAAVVPFVTLYAAAWAASGRAPMRLWGPSIRGAALFASVLVLAWSIQSARAWNEIGVVTFIAVWLSCCVFLALGVVRAAAFDEPLPVSESDPRPA